MITQSAIKHARRDEAYDRKLEILLALEKKILWLSTWMIHHANHLRPKHDGLKVGGHQASSASVVTLMTALYFDALRPQDRVAVKPHASPVFHAIQYLFGNQTRDNLERFRAFAGAQSYPSRVKDCDDVDFSTGSVGLGVGITVFAAIVQDLVRLKALNESGEPGTEPGRMIALVGDAELDEGNVFEAMFEGWKHDARNVWWIIDYNRQSLDNITEDQTLGRIHAVFESMGWNVCVLKYGKRLQRIATQPGGDALLQWIDSCPNALYSALVFKGGAAWRERLQDELGATPGIREILESHDDDELQALMTNLAGHDMATVLEAMADVKDDTPTCFVAYTIKGYGLPFAGHKENHAGLLSIDQMKVLKESMKIADGEEWERFTSLAVPEDEVQAFVERSPILAAGPRQFAPPKLAVPDDIAAPKGNKLSTQAGFGRLLNDLAHSDSELAASIVTTSPDVTVSTNLGSWVNRRGVFRRDARSDQFDSQQIGSTQQWAMTPKGQHIELGIAENNLFLLLGALGLSGPLFGQRLIPIGTLYDPFISRGLDALNYACYQGARFILVATPSGLTLGPEGGSHQSILSPLIGIGQPGLTYFEPAYVDELAAILQWSLHHMQDEDGGSIYLRLSTRPNEQPSREMTDSLRQGIIDGAYWLVEPGRDSDLALVCCGAVTPEAMAAHEMIRDDFPEAGLMVVTSPDRLHANWLATGQRRVGRDNMGLRSTVEQLLGTLSPHANLITLIDGHPLTLSWLGSVWGQRVMPLGFDRFGQSGELTDLYRAYRMDGDAIVDAAIRTCVEQIYAVRGT